MMPFSTLRTRLIAAMLAGVVCVAAPALAQYQPDPSAALSDYLKRLASDPRDAEALVGAGEAALKMGDPEGAVGFFGRAEEIRPRDGRIKAGLGASLVQMGQPAAAIRFFDEAQSYGLPPAQMAKDRGLAYDMIGDPRRAQREYRIGLQTGPDDELTRRLALSLAISGDRAGALQAIDAQLRQQDRAAWRTRAFILALTGDVAGATQTTADVTSPSQAEAMRPFFARLPSLTAAQRAMAVHFGEMPSDGRGTQTASNLQASPYAPPLAADEAGRLNNGGATPRPRESALPPPAAPRRRPGDGGSEVSAGTVRTAPQPSTTVRPTENRPISLLPPQTGSAASSTLPPPATNSDELPSTRSARAPAQAAPPPQQRSSLDGVANMVVTLPYDEAVVGNGGQQLAAKGAADTSDDLSGIPRIERAPGKAPVIVLPPSDVKKPVVTAEAKPVPEKKAPPKKAEPAKPKEPSRYWVQIAGGANKATLPREFKRLQDKAPKLLGSRTAWTTPLRATNRLLVGPFKSEAEARKFVNDLADADLTAFSWTSPDGQKIEKLASK